MMPTKELPDAHESRLPSRVGKTLAPYSPGAMAGGVVYVAGDLQRHWQSLLAYEVKVVELDWSRIKSG